MMADETHMTVAELLDLASRLATENERLRAREAALVEIAEEVAGMRVETEIFDQPLYALMHDDHETNGAWHLELVAKARALLAEGEGQ